MIVRSVSKVEEQWVIETESRAMPSCPTCGAVFERRHRWYQGSLRELPMQGVPVGSGRREVSHSARTTDHGLTAQDFQLLPDCRNNRPSCGASHKGQFERDLIRERTRAGLPAAAAQRRKGARKPVITEEKPRRAREMMGKGLTVREAALRLRVGKTALYEALR